MLMDQELPCDFYFGDDRRDGIKPVDTSLLKNFKGYFHNINFGPFYWQKGVLKLLKSDYSEIITPGDTYCLSTWVFLFFAKRYKKNVFLWTHGAYGDEKGIKKWLFKKNKSKAKGVFLYGNYAKEILMRWGIPQSKLHVIYNSLSYDEQLEMRHGIVASDIYQNHFKNNNPNLVFIGRLTTVKKLDQMIKAVAILKEKGEAYNLTFIGDGMEYKRLETMSKELGLQNNIWFYGACYDEKQNATFLYNADICVSPGNVGLTAIHALTFGCPVISHNNFSKQMPEFEAIEVGKTGAFFKENDVEDLAATIIKWQSTCGNRDVVRQACYKVIEDKYNPHVQLETLKTVINSN